MLVNFPTSNCKEEILDQPIFLILCNKLDFCCNKTFFYPTQLPSLVSNVNHERMYKLIIYLIPNYWKHMSKTEASLKFFLKNVCYNNKGTIKCKRLPKTFYQLSTVQKAFNLQYIE